MSCIQPLTLPDRIVPCQKCYNCKISRVNGWVLRLQEEQKNFDLAFFITLTYEDEKNTKKSNVACRTVSGRHTLVKRDLQDYFRSVRKLSKKHGRNTLKYYACGEYGPKSGRPHYHAIVFGASDLDLRAKWLHGFVHVGSVTSNSIAYCLKYISKRRAVPEYPGDDRQKEFSVMSKKIGTGYITTAMVRWHNIDCINRGCAIRDGGYKFPLPRYFKERIFSISQRSLIARHYEAEYLKFQLLEIERQYSGDYHQEWLMEKKRIADIVDASYRIMKHLSKQNLKI